MTRDRVLVGAYAAILAGVLATASPATSPGRNGRLAFMRKDANGHWQVWVSGPRLAGARRLTNQPADSGWPTWSPTGTTLAFDSSRGDPDPSDATAVNDVFVMNPDGSEVTKLTDSVGASADPAWSPDGSLIAFDADRGDSGSEQGIYVMNPDGGDVTRVTKRPSGYQADLAPRFSPDGRRIVFTRYRGSGRSETAALYTVGVDGTGLATMRPDGSVRMFLSRANVESHQPDWQSTRP